MIAFIPLKAPDPFFRIFYYTTAERMGHCLEGNEKFQQPGPDYDPQRVCEAWYSARFDASWMAFYFPPSVGRV